MSDEKAPAENQERHESFEVIEAEHKTGHRHKGIYLLPNLFTTAALFAGFFAIVSAMDGQFLNAALAIIAAGILDGMDGGVARLTNTQSKFGAEYDSLSDCVAFGVAPGLVAYSWALSGMGKIGWAVAFIYVACAALRLARFNVQAESTDKRFFIGLPSPSAAGVVAVMVWLGSSRGIDGHDISWLVAFLVTLIGLLMVSSVPYHSFKEWHIGRVPFRALLGAVVALAIILMDPPLVLLVVGIIYVGGGLVMALWRLRSEGRPLF